MVASAPHQNLHRCHPERHRHKSKTSSETYEDNTVSKVIAQVYHQCCTRTRDTNKLKVEETMSQCVSSSLKHLQTEYGKNTCQPLSVANFSGTTTHCGHELGKPRLCPSASTLSHLSGLGKTSMGLPTATSGNQAFLSSMVATASAGGTWVNCYIAERTPNGNCTPHNCLQVDGDLNCPTIEKYQCCHPAQTCAPIDCTWAAFLGHHIVRKPSSRNYQNIEEKPIGKR